jgi:hypothetical protein
MLNTEFYVEKDITQKCNNHLRPLYIRIRREIFRKRRFCKHSCMKRRKLGVFCNDVVDAKGFADADMFINHFKQCEVSRLWRCSTHVRSLAEALQLGEVALCLFNVLLGPLREILLAFNDACERIYNFHQIVTKILK